MSDWPFSEPESSAVFTTKSIVSGESWIHFVSHDLDDGAWQFHPPGDGPSPVAEAAVVGLGTIYGIDPSIAEFEDLPPGWYAWRDTPDPP